MKLIELRPDDLRVSADLTRSGRAKAFEERLRSSIEEIGLAEPLKVAKLVGGGYLVIDGTMRLRAIQAIRESQPERFNTVPAYVFDYTQRYELRYQSDIYQDLLPSQLAQLVEHLHASEHVKKLDIARYIGVSPATLRNYTGLARLLKRRGLFADVVALMDAEVLPASNPFAWVRLTASGVRQAIADGFAGGQMAAEAWITARLADAQQGRIVRYPVAMVETITGSLSGDCYVSSEEERSVKKDFGLRRAQRSRPRVLDFKPARRHLNQVAKESNEVVLQTAAKSLRAYLR